MKLLKTKMEMNRKTMQSTTVQKVNSKWNVWSLLTVTTPRKRKMTTSLMEAKVLTPALTVVKLCGDMFVNAYLKLKIVNYKWTNKIDFLPFLSNTTAYQTDDSGPMNSFSKNETKVGRGPNHQWFNHSSMLGEFGKVSGKCTANNANK